MYFGYLGTDQLSIKEIDEKIEQTREQINKIDSANTWGKGLFIIFLFLALLGVSELYSDFQWYRHVTNVEAMKSFLWDVLLISIFLMIPFMSLWVVKVDGRELVDGGGFAHFCFFTALIAECCGIYFGNDGFALCACWSILLAALVLGVGCGVWGVDPFDVFMSLVVCGALLCVHGNDIFCFLGHVHDKNPECCSFILWGYVIVAFGVTILAAWRFKIACGEEGDRLRELICEYEKKIKERQEEELSDEGKLKRAIDRFRV